MDIDILKLWKDYNLVSEKLSNALGRTDNILGEYAEYIVNSYYGGVLLPASSKSADIKDKNGKLYQVKARKVKKTTSTQLGIIRSWDFDFLVVVLFNSDGTIYKVLEVPVEKAKKYAKENKHQNGYVITTSSKFINDIGFNDLTSFFRI